MSVHTMSAQVLRLGRNALRTTQGLEELSIQRANSSNRRGVIATLIDGRLSIGNTTFVLPSTEDIQILLMDLNGVPPGERERLSIKTNFGKVVLPEGEQKVGEATHCLAVVGPQRTNLLLELGEERRLLTFGPPFADYPACIQEGLTYVTLREKGDRLYVGENLVDAAFLDQANQRLVLAGSTGMTVSYQALLQPNRLLVISDEKSTVWLSGNVAEMLQPIMTKAGEQLDATAEVRFGAVFEKRIYGLFPPVEKRSNDRLVTQLELEFPRVLRRRFRLAVEPRTARVLWDVA